MVCQGITRLRHGGAKFLAAASLFVLAAPFLCAQGARGAGAKSASTRSASTPANLEAALTQMDQAATNFKNAEAEFVWDQYEKVVDVTDTQKGRIYFRRQNRETQMLADVSEPDRKYVLLSEGKIRVYQPKPDLEQVYDVGKHRNEVESFLVMGFGGRGHDLLKSFDVTHDGFENVDGVETVKLTLVPKLPKVRNMFSSIVLWVDTRDDISRKQQFFEPSGDYRVLHYMHIKVNQKLPAGVFKLNTTNKTSVVRPQG